MNGVINILKPAGMTSHDVVGKLRRILNTKKVGHTGTLDPDAVGVLPVCVGQGTRLVEYLMEKDKVYKVLMKFGSETDTQDASGEVTKTTDLPTMNREEFEEILKGFLGEIDQVPPMYSAIKRDGQPLYKLARQGIEVEIEPRKVMIYGINLLMYTPEQAMLEVHCGKGTYIRALCQDIGRACNSSAHMGYLLRTKSGEFTMEDAVSLEQLATVEDPGSYIVGLNDAIGAMTSIVISHPRAIQKLNNGMTIDVKHWSNGDADIVKAVTEEQQLLAIGSIMNQQFKPNKVFR